MCGIFCALSTRAVTHPSSGLQQLLDKRGPNAASFHHLQLPQQNDQSGPVYLSFYSTVLALRGDHIVPQPLLDPNSGSVFCWNGEAWAIDDVPVTGNDSEKIFRLLRDGLHQEPSTGPDLSAALVAVISQVTGPYAFIYYDSRSQYLLYGRDCLGRRSLLKGTNDAGDIILSSIREIEGDWKWSEVDADGIYVMDLCPTDLTTSEGTLSASQSHLPYVRQANGVATKHQLVGFTALSSYLATDSTHRFCHILLSIKHYLLKYFLV